LTLTPKGERMEARFSLLKGFELIPLSPDSFVRADADVRYQFAKDPSARDQVVIPPEGAESRTGRRVAETVRVPADELESGKLDAAIAGYRRLREANPSDPSVAEGRLNELGYALLNQEEYKPAISIFQLNTELYPDSAHTGDSRAKAQIKKGNRKQATPLYRKALEPPPRDNPPDSVKESVKASSPAKLKELGVDKP